MRDGARIAVILPVLNEEQALAGVLSQIPAWVDRVIVVDNGSHDASAVIATASGATLVKESIRGYGAACQAGIRALGEMDLVVFLDADGSFDPAEMQELVAPILNDGADLVIGVRLASQCEPGAQTLPQAFGNWLACRLIGLRWGYQVDDLGPYRAIHCSALQRLSMSDLDFGWTVEMQLKACRYGLNVQQTPVSCRRRHGGRSKVSGTVVGVTRAGYKIMRLILFPPRSWAELV